MKKDEVLADITQRIISGEIPPGTWLTEREICTHYDISRTPIREILWHLASLNLVEQTADKGCRVKTYSINDIIEIYNARESVEASCARLACLSIDADCWKEVDFLLDKLENCTAFTNLDDAIKYGNAVHTLCRKMGGNQYLNAFYSQIADVTLIINKFAYRHKEIEENSRNGHIAILKALKERDQQKCAQEMSRHLHSTCQYIVNTICNNLLGSI